VKSHAATARGDSVPLARLAASGTPAVAHGDKATTAVAGFGFAAGLGISVSDEVLRKRDAAIQHGSANALLDARQLQSARPFLDWRRLPARAPARLARPTEPRETPMTDTAQLSDLKDERDDEALDEPIPAMQQLLDNPFLLLFIGVAMPTVLYVIWGVMEIVGIPIAK